MNLKKVFTCIFLFVLLSLCNAETPNEIAAIADEAAAVFVVGVAESVFAAAMRAGLVFAGV